MSDIDAKATGVRFELPLLVTLVVAVAGAVWMAAQAWSDLSHRLSSFEERLSALPTRTEVVSLKVEASDAALRKLKDATVRCPKVVRSGESVITCRLVWSPE